MNDLNTKDYETGYAKDDDDDDATESQEIGVESGPVNANFVPFANNNTLNNNPTVKANKKVILADRLTHITAKQIDHPTIFAKGMYENDSTPTGVYFTTGTTGTAGIDTISKNVVKLDTVTESNTSSSSRNNNDNETTTSSSKEDEYCAAPVGWSFHRLGTHHQLQAPSNSTVVSSVMAPEEGEVHAEQVVPKQFLHKPRKFSPRDMDLKFNPREEFAGRRPGFVFRLGAQGLGYYEDDVPNVPMPNESPHES